MLMLNANGSMLTPLIVARPLSTKSDTIEKSFNSKNLLVWSISYFYAANSRLASAALPGVGKQNRSRDVTASGATGAANQLASLAGPVPNDSAAT